MENGGNFSSSPSINEKIALRKLSRLPYHDTTSWLKKLRAIEYEVALSNVSNSVRHLRTNGLKRWRESREVALFLEGIEQKTGIETSFASVEDQDYDAVARWDANSARHFCLIQVKEVPPVETSPHASLETVVNDLRKYSDAKKLTVVIHLNRRLSDFRFTQLHIPQVELGEVWAIFAANESQSKWGLVGNLLRSDFSISHFDYPSVD